MAFQDTLSDESHRFNSDSKNLKLKSEFSLGEKVAGFLGISGVAFGVLGQLQIGIPLVTLGVLVAGVEQWRQNKIKK